jgi:HSP20 family molecular chaperone IbpA
MIQMKTDKQIFEPGRLLSAGAETLYPASFDFAESDDELILRIELPDVTVEQHNVIVEPHAVAITTHARCGEDVETHRDIPSESSLMEILQVLDLPIEVDPTVTTATLTFGMLELRMPRGARVKAVPIPSIAS